MKQFRFMAGLPRSGSTVLSALLYQNPMLHTEGLSSLGSLMLNAHIALDSDQIKIAERGEHSRSIVGRLPELYYENVKRQVAIDRNRAWCYGDHKAILLEYFVDPKVLCTVRNRNDILKSFEYLFDMNGKDFYTSSMYSGFLEAEKATGNALRSGDKMFMFLDYDQFVDSPQKSLELIYDFFDLPNFAHNLESIEQFELRGDNFYSLTGLHEIGKCLARRGTHSVFANVVSTNTDTFTPPEDSV